MIFDYLSSGAVYPMGWVKKQLELQAEGLNGNLDKIWPDVRDSKWIGGDRDGWEKFPYFLDGFIPLSFLLRNEDMISRAGRYLDEMLSCQDESGCFYPKGTTGKECGDIWSLFLILKVLVVYERYSCDERIENAVRKGLMFLDGYICHHPPYNWAAARWFECIIPIIWLYKRTGEPWLIDLAKRLRTLGVDYRSAIDLWKKAEDRWSFETHGVNISMALKAEALYCEITGEKPSGLAEKMLETLLKYHGNAYDHFNADECLSGTSPVQGSELCGIVEAMYSYEWLTVLTGESKWGDRLESLTFNALPAAVSEDMWSHQYDQQVNQIACMRFEKSIFRTNGPESNMFGLEPHYGCCTANFGQGFPKYVASSFLSEDEKLVIVSPIPARISYNDNTIICNSEYPFRKTFSIFAEKNAIIKLRIPPWISNKDEYEAENGWIEYRIKGGDTVDFTFDAQPRIEKRPLDNACVRYGALLFAIPIKERVKRIEYTRDGVERKYPYCDYSVTPVGEWRYALAKDSGFTVRELPFDRAFSRTEPPLRITAEFAPVVWDTLKQYGLITNCKSGNKRIGENVKLDMQPYGCTNLRITEVSVIQDD